MFNDKTEFVEWAVDLFEKYGIRTPIEPEATWPNVPAESEEG
jgi:hypothetical protein